MNGIIEERTRLNKDEVYRNLKVLRYVSAYNCIASNEDRKEIYSFADGGDSLLCLEKGRLCDGQQVGEQYV
jgi:hypothetical protein